MGASAKETSSDSTMAHTAGGNVVTDNTARRKRVNRLKKMIIITILSAIIIPVIICVILAVQVVSLKDKLRETQATCDALLLTMADGSFHLNEEEFPGEEETLLEEESMEEESSADEPYEETNTRKVYLTFDDGPSANTEAILAVLKQYGVKATFFVTGEEATSHPERYQAIVKEGHTLGMHSYSHRYNEIYESEEAFGSDLFMLQEFLKETTQVTPQFYRFPGGSSNTVSKQPMSVFCDYLTDNGITYFDWNVSSGDATSPMRSVREIVHNCTESLNQHDTAVILMHDASNKSSTVEALPQIIETIQAMENTEILPITEETLVIHH